MSYFLRADQPSSTNSSPRGGATASNAGSRAMSAYSPLNNSTHSYATSQNVSPEQQQQQQQQRGDGPLLFNDVETHDIVIVAVGDRGLSGAHNDLLLYHTEHGGCSSERERSLALRSGGVTGGGQERGSSPEQQFHMEFYAHKEVLSACSDFFRSFFHDENMQKLRHNNEQKKQPFEPCRRLVVHNVLPASLAHVMQSMYAAYSNGTHATADGVTLYDPVALSTAAPSVIICAWELCMKLGLRVAAASATHILIPMISADNSLEVLKATTKYSEHEFAIVLQRACVHAKALPPAIRTEADRRLWQELCESIPWLASTAALIGGDDGSEQQSLNGRKQARSLLMARKRQKMLESVDSKKSAAVFGEDDVEQHVADNDDDDDNESVGASTQRAWDETQSQIEYANDNQNQQQQQQQQFYDNDDGDEEEGQQQHQQHQQQQRQPFAFQHQTNQQMLGVNSRLTPVPLSSVEALCLHNDRTGSAQAERNHHAAAASSTRLSLKKAAQPSHHHHQASSAFIPSSSTAAAESQRRSGSSSKFADPTGPAATVRDMPSSLKHKVLASAPAANMADALQSRDPVIRVTATRTVLRDAMARSGSSSSKPHPSPTADLPFHHHQQQHHSGSRTASTTNNNNNNNNNVDQQQQQHLFVERTLPNFEQRFVQGNFGDHRQLVIKKDTTSTSDDGTHQLDAVDDVVARHKIASLEKDIQNTYDLYSNEMGDYRGAYEALRKETTELWAGTGLVEMGNVPSSVQVAEEMHHGMMQEREQEERSRAELVGALGAVAAQADEEAKFAQYAEQFMKAAGIAVEDLGSFLDQARSLVDQYSAAADQRSSSSSESNGMQRAERQRTMRRALEIHIDEAIRRVADEEREAEARLRAHEVTLEQMQADVEQEQRRLQAVKMKHSTDGNNKGKLAGSSSSKRGYY